MIYFTADTHFYCENVTRYEHRPFRSAGEMNEALIRNWNAKVSGGDDVYILGDFALNDPALVNTVLERLNGRKYLIRGDHDEYVDQNAFRPDLFVWIKDYFELCWQGQFFILCHYPLRSWKGMDQGTFHLHGHEHTKISYNKDNRDSGDRRLDVGVDAQGMSPVSVKEILAFWDAEYGDASYGRIKPGDIRLEQLGSYFPEDYNAYDKEGNLIGYIRMDDRYYCELSVKCGDETIFEAGCFKGWKEKAVREIAKYYRDKERDANL